MSASNRESFTADDPGIRLDVFLARRLPRLKRSYVQELIGLGLVTIGGSSCKPSRLLKAGETVEIQWERESPHTEGDFESWVLREDEELLVLRKPAGLLMHPLGESWLSVPEAALTGESSLAAFLIRARPRSALKVRRCGIVHRLDRPTSGVLLVAKTPAAYDKLVEDFKARRIGKIYRAVVRGAPQERELRVEAPIGRKPGHRRVTVTPFGKPAQTGFKVLGRAASAALVEARPLTGRTHQIRAHLALLGHPVAGDPEYDDPKATPKPPRLMLHAYRLRLAHPASGRPLDLRAEPPADFTRFWRECRRS